MRNEVKLFFLFFLNQLLAAHPASGIRPVLLGTGNWPIPTAGFPHPTRGKERLECVYAPVPSPSTELSFYKSREEQVRATRAERSGRGCFFWLRQRFGASAPGCRSPPAPGSPLRVSRTVPWPTGQRHRGQARARTSPRRPARGEVPAQAWPRNQSERTEAFFTSPPPPPRQTLALRDPRPGGGARQPQRDLPRSPAPWAPRPPPAPGGRRRGREAAGRACAALPHSGPRAARPRSSLPPAPPALPPPRPLFGLAQRLAAGASWGFNANHSLTPGPTYIRRPSPARKCAESAEVLLEVLETSG